MECQSQDALHRYSVLGVGRGPTSLAHHWLVMFSHMFLLVSSNNHCMSPLDAYIAICQFILR